MIRPVITPIASRYCRYDDGHGLDANNGAMPSNSMRSYSCAAISRCVEIEDFLR
jgi:hypothetical protein